MAVIRGVVFDAYGTLFDVYSIGRKAEQLFPGMGVAISTVWRDKQIEYSRLVSLSDPSAHGSRHYQSFWVLTRAALEYSLAKLGLAYDQGKVEDLMRGYATLDAYPECEGVLRAVKAMGLPTAILSNGSPEMLSSAAESSGLIPYLDHLISVDRVRQFKTSPVSYGLVSQTLKMPAESLLFVSSNAWDALGATWHGFQTCWVNRQGLPFEKLGPPPHHACPDLKGIPEVILGR